MNVKCKICSKEFYVKPSHKKMGWGKFCSLQCAYIARRKGKELDCAECGKRIYRSPKQLKKSKSQLYFCTKSCHQKYKNKFMSGENHPQWKYGKYYYLPLMKRKKKMICMKCNEKNKKVLVVHHIDRNRKNNELENLIWLCRNCHYLVHQYKEKF